MTLFDTPPQDPFGLFDSWMADAAQSEVNDPNAMALATADASGLPNVRMVLLKGVDARGFVSKAKRGVNCTPTRRRLCVFTGKVCSDRCACVGRSARLMMLKPMLISLRAAARAGWVLGRRSNRGRLVTARNWTPRMKLSRRAMALTMLFPARRTGQAAASHRSVSSFGRTATTDFTTDWCMLALRPMRTGKRSACTLKAVQRYASGRANAKPASASMRAVAMVVLSP